MVLHFMLQKNFGSTLCFASSIDSTHRFLYLLLSLNFF